MQNSFYPTMTYNLALHFPHSHFLQFIEIDKCRYLRSQSLCKLLDLFVWCLDFDSRIAMAHQRLCITEHLGHRPVLT